MTVAEFFKRNEDYHARKSRREDRDAKRDRCPKCHKKKYDCRCVRSAVPCITNSNIPQENA